MGICTGHNRKMRAGSLRMTFALITGLTLAFLILMLMDAVGMPQGNYGGRNRMGIKMKRTRETGLTNELEAMRQNLELSFNVKQFGAIGDDVAGADDTAAIQEGIDRTANGGELVFPKGTYVCGNLTLTDATNQTLRGLGATIKWTGTAASGNNIGFQLIGTIDNLLIEGLTLEGDNVVANGHAGIWGLSGQTLSNITIRNNTIIKCVVGISLNADLGGTIVDCVIEGNHLEDIIGEASGTGYGIHHANGSGSPSNLTIANNTLVKCHRHSIYQARGSNVTIIGNTVRLHRDGDASPGSPRAAISVSRSQDVTVIGNTLDNCRDTSIYIDLGAGSTSVNTVIANNTISNPQGPFGAIGIGSVNPSVDGVVEGVSVIGNTIESDASSSALIQIWSGVRILISKNILRLTNVPGTAGAIDFRVVGDHSGTADYTDNIVVSDNNIHVTDAAGTGHGINWDDGALNSISKFFFSNNHYFLPSGRDAHVVRITAMTNRNISVFGEVSTGLEDEMLKCVPSGPIDSVGTLRSTAVATSVLTGTIDPAASTAVVGVGTLFTTELVVGDRITVTGETRTVTAITDNLNLTVDAAFSDNANDTSPDKLHVIFVLGDTSGVPVFIVQDTGNVGFGVIAALSPIHVATSLGRTIYINNSGNSGWMTFAEAGVDRGLIGYADEGGIFTGASPDSLSLRAEGDLHLGGSGNDLAMTLKDGKAGIGTITPDRKVHSEVSDSATNVVANALRLSHVTDQTVVAGFGVGVEFELEGGDGTNLVVGTIENVLTDAGTGVEDADLVFGVTKGGAVAAEVMRIKADNEVVVTGDINPEADGTRDLGTQTTAQWANVWSDLINGADYSLLNGWRILESDKYEGYPQGIAIGRDGFQAGIVTERMDKNVRPVLVVTEEFIEYKGRRITPEMLDWFMAMVSGV